MPISTTKVIDVEQSLRDDLSQYLCGSIWNNPLTELRRNITLRALNRGLCSKNICDIGGGYVLLPNVKYEGKTHEYYVYAAACCCMGGLVVDCKQSDVKSLDHFGEWVRLDQYLNIRPFDLRIHSTHGEWMHRNRVFIMNHPSADMFLIAIDSRMADKVLGNGYSFTTMYMSVYYDSDNNMAHLDRTSPTIDSVYIESRDQINDVYNKWLELDHDKSFLFLNGRLSTPSSLFDITTGDFVEIVYDPDIVANVVLDLVKCRDSHIYESEIDGTLKYIIHIPKEKNKSNHIITHNTCDVFISPLNTSPVEYANLKGLFVHRFDTSYRRYEYRLTTDERYRRGRDYYSYDSDTKEYVKKYLREEDYGTLISNETFVRVTEYLSDHLITQITHNDFGISERLIQPYMETIGSSECSIRVVVRRHSKNNVLDRDCNFIKFLYEFDDETILKFLSGYKDMYCPFWNAKELEKSEWIKTLFEVPSKMYEESTSHYLSALGYFNSACVISRRITSGLYSTQNTHAIDFPIPRSLQSSNELDSLFTINGKLVRQDEYTDTKEMQYLHIDVNDDVEINKNDELVAEIFEKKSMRAEYFTPTSGNHSFVIPEDSVDIDFDLYLVNDSPEIDGDYFIDNYVDRTNLKSYKKVVDQSEWISIPAVVTYRTVLIDEKPQQILTKRTVIFKPSAYGKEFLILSKEVYSRFTESDIELSGGNATLSTIASPDMERTCTDLLHTGKLEMYCRHWTDSDYETIPIIDSELAIIPFCNGRELVENVDYSDVMLRDTGGYAVYRTLIFSVGGLGQTDAMGDDDVYDRDSYLKYENNQFDILVTDDRLVNSLSGFATSTDTLTVNTGTIEDILPRLYWFNELSKLVVDGKTVYRPNLSDGKIMFLGDHRNGALYKSRGVVPSNTIQFIEQYQDAISDLNKLSGIITYIRSLNEGQTIERTLIPHSHHITSVTTNCLVKDVISGKKELYWTSASNQIKDLVSEYRSMAKYDPALSGAIKDITVRASGSAFINDRYHLVDSTAIGNSRVWKSTNKMSKIAYNTNDSRWEISVKTIYGEVVYYHATTNDEHDPWNLGWARDNGPKPMPIIENEGLDVRYVDILPSYTSDVHEVDEDIMLRRCINALLPADTTKDGATTL